MTPRDGRNPFRSILARGVEVVYALDEAVRIIEGYVKPAEAAADVPGSPPESRGCAITEAPRGSLYHRYDLAEGGVIRAARIVPPTTQNLPAIEDDLRGSARILASLPEDAARARAEHAIRNYDPCISCATHFLKLRVVRS